MEGSSTEANNLKNVDNNVEWYYWFLFSLEGSTGF